MTGSLNVSHEQPEVVTKTEPQETDQFYNRISSLCVFFEVADKTELATIQNLIEKEHRLCKEFHALIFSKKKSLIPETEKTYYITNQDFTIWGKKKVRLQRWITQHHFDLFVGFVPAPKRKSRSLIRDIDAEVKMGPAHTKAGEIYQVNIHYDSALKVPNFFEWVKKYYIQLNFNNNTNRDESQN